MKRQCFLDMDGVLVDFNGGAHREHGRPNCYELNPNEHRWNIEDIWGISSKEFWKPLARKGFWYELDKTPEADLIVELAVELFGKENICVLTSPSLDENCVPEKRAWIAKHYPWMKNQMLFGHQKQFVASPNRTLIDDRDRNVEAWRKLGGMVFLLPRPWNTNSYLTYDMDVEIINFFDYLKEAHTDVSFPT